MVVSIPNKLHQLYRDYVVPTAKKVDKFLQDYRIHVAVFTLLVAMVQVHYDGIQSEKLQLVTDLSVKGGENNCASWKRLAEISVGGLHVNDLPNANILQLDKSILGSRTWTQIDLFHAAISCWKGNITEFLQQKV